MFKTKWRIVEDAYIGYIVQYKVWYWPFYILHTEDGFSSFEKAFDYVKRHREYRKVVWKGD